MSDDWKGEDIIRNVERTVQQRRGRKPKGVTRMCRKCNAPMPSGGYEDKRVICRACTKAQLHELDRGHKKPVYWRPRF